MLCECHGEVVDFRYIVKQNRAVAQYKDNETAKHAVKQLSIATINRRLFRVEISKFDHVFMGDCEIDRPKDFLNEPHAAALLQPNRIQSWDFPIFELAEKIPKKTLSLLAYKIFETLGFFNRYDISPVKFLNYFSQLERHYGANPYHSSLHGADVLQSSYSLITQTIQGLSQYRSDKWGVTREQDNLIQYLLPLEIMAMCVAAAAHDFRHPGKTNAYLIATGDELALVYNDISVLENMHASESWKLLMDPKNAFLSNLDKKDFERFRKLVLAMILSTDLANHQHHVRQFNEKCSLGLNWAADEDRLLVMKMVIKMADLSTPCKEWNLHSTWTTLIQKEFYLQGDDERNRGWAVMPQMDRHHADLAKSQLSFITGLVQPLVYSLEFANLLPVGRHGVKSVMTENMEENIRVWKMFDAPLPPEEDVDW